MSPSRRTFLTSAAAGGTLALTRPGSLLARSGQEPRGEFVPIRRNVGIFVMRGGTIGWLVNGDGVAVVDSQYPAEAAVCIAGLSERSGRRKVDLLLNTHHHGDHTGGNGAFRGIVGRVVAHAQAAEHLRNPPAGPPPADTLLPDTTFTDGWIGEVGDERVSTQHRGRAHTSGDALIRFEQANVVHMGDLLFHRRHPVVDRASGASLRNWIRVLEQTVADHPKDTVYIFGHAGVGFPVTGSWTDLVRFRDYLEAVLSWVGSRVQAGDGLDQITALRDPLEGFEDYGPFGDPGPREVRTCAFEELTREG